MKVAVYRRSLDLASGAGQIIAAHADALEAAGATVRLVARRGRLKFFARSGRWPRGWTEQALADLQARSGWRIVDHSLEMPNADVVFVHNLQSEANRFLARPELEPIAEHERRFFLALRRDAIVVANSTLVANVLTRDLGVAAHAVTVLNPGYSARRFDRAVTRALRPRARAELGVDPAAPLVGFVTSGDLQKRGIEAFMTIAEGIRAAVPNARFLVVGSKALPESASTRRVVEERVLLHRPKSADPRRWFAALDVFLYPAVFEEFGMVVLEALACGLPVLTSKRVGAAECLPPEYEPWLLEAPDTEEFTARAIALIEGRTERERLATAGAAAAVRYDVAAQARAAAALIVGSESPAQVEADAS